MGDQTGEETDFESLSRLRILQGIKKRNQCHPCQDPASKLRKREKRRRPEIRHHRFRAIKRFIAQCVEAECMHLFQSLASS